MNTTFKKIMYYSLIVCYSLSAMVGVVVLGELLNSAGTQYQLTAEKKSRPVSDAPVWTVKTHIPPVLHSELSVHFGFVEDIFIVDRSRRIYGFVDFQSRYTHLECLPSKPRDPPII